MEQRRKIHIIYMAAGNSTRFGGNKLLYKLDGKPLFRFGLEALLDAAENNPDIEITVVTQYAEIMECLEAEGIKCVYSPDSCFGISYTIKAGIESLEDVSTGDFLVFVVADQPNLSAETVNKLIESIRDESEILSVSYKGKKGNPVAFSERLIGDLMKLYGDEGGKTLFSRYNVEFVEISDNRELVDVDEKNDLLYN